MRVLIIGINYRPELTGIGPYTPILPSTWPPAATGSP